MPYLKQVPLLLLIYVFLVGSSTCRAQSASVNEHGFYIPRDLPEANEQLDKALSAKAKAKFKGLTPRDFEHVSGIFLIGEWDDDPAGTPSRFVRYLNGHLRLTSDEWDYSEWQDRNYLVLLSYWRHLNQQPFDIAVEAGRIVTKRDSLAREAERIHARNLLADSIDGVYIPRNLAECFTELDRMLPDSVRYRLKQANTDSGLGEYHMGLGRWLRNNWGLWGGSRLQTYFEGLGIHHPDHMSGVILVRYHHYLNGQPTEESTLQVYRQPKASETKEEPVPPPPPPVKEKTRRKDYTKPYRRFLRKRAIDDFDATGPETW
ncbi:hypothetical protein HER32_16810 [Hymenobacter sp. BT18]|uniref:DUF6794 domain-containing protein n=1 Tax=Hymenobacter sp. BT18 TaxID=2835648 RepID=UPI00143EA79B|nr:DUF6794 domain-containing protein [Hymenobacter sp. BT18]QIX62743.1 hypothetical protein HER32_16810 [Hymenobacter sp. BT18]